VYLRASGTPTAQANNRDSLELSPSPGPMLPTKACEIADGPTGCDRLDVSDLADQLEVHSLP
jgi:hypothetical protein